MLLPEEYIIIASALGGVRRDVWAERSCLVLWAGGRKEAEVLHSEGGCLDWTEKGVSKVHAA